MTRALAVADRTRPAPGDMLDFDDEAQHRRLVMARVNGVDPRFCAIFNQVAPGADLRDVVPAIFSADRRAGLIYKAIRRHRAPALRAVRARITRLGAIIELMRQLDYAGDDDLPDQAIAEIAEALRGVAPPELGLENHRLIAVLIAKREAFEVIERMLDGRGSPPSRLRLFGDLVAPIFARAAASDRKTRSDFRDFLAAAAGLVTGVEPDRGLANSVARALFK